MNDLERELMQTLKNFALQYEQDKEQQAESTAKLNEQIDNLANSINNLNERVSSLSENVESLKKSYQDIQRILEN